MRTALVAVALSALAAPVAAQTRPVPNPVGAIARLAYAVLSIPFAYSRRLPDEGFALAPYADGETGDVGDEQRLHRVEAVCHRTGDDAGGCGARWRMDAEVNVGADASWTRYRERGAAELDYLRAGARGDILRDSDARLEYRLGVAGLTGRRNRAGPYVSVEMESYPLAPLRFDASLTGAAIDEGPLGDLSAGAALVAGRMETRLGWRLVTGPFPDLSGPELSLTWRF